MSATDEKDNLDGAGLQAAASDALTRLLELLRRNVELDLRVAAPAHVLSYNPATQRADLALGFLPVEYVQGEEVKQPPLPLPQVPVQWPGTSAGYLTTPLVPGDTGLVVFADRALTKWLENPAPGPADPRNGRTHDLADGVFFPGLRVDSGAITPPTSLTNTVLEGPFIALTAAASEPVLLGTRVISAITAYCSAIAAAFATWNSATGGNPVFATPPVNGAFLQAIGNATATLAGTIATWPSTRVFTS